MHYVQIHVYSSGRCRVELLSDLPSSTAVWSTVRPHKLLCHPMRRHISPAFHSSPVDASTCYRCLRSEAVWQRDALFQPDSTDESITGTKMPMGPMRIPWEWEVLLYSVLPWNGKKYSNGLVGLKWNDRSKWQKLVETAILSRTRHPMMMMMMMMMG